MRSVTLEVNIEGTLCHYRQSQQIQTVWLQFCGKELPILLYSMIGIERRYIVTYMRERHEMRTKTHYLIRTSSKQVILHTKLNN